MNDEHQPHPQLMAELTQLRRRVKELESLEVEHSRIEKAFHLSEERFRQVISSISDHIYVTKVADDDTRVNLYLSPHVELLTGYPHQKFTERWDFWPLHVIHPDDRAKAAFQAAELSKGLNSEAEYRLIRQDGTIIWVRDSARVRTEGGEKIVYGLVSDITERKQAEVEIKKLNESLEQRVASRTRELLALYEVTAVASEALDLDTILERLLERSLIAMSSTMGTIHTLDETENVLRLDVQQALPPDIVAQVARVPLGSGLPGWVFEHVEPLLVPKLHIDPRAPEIASDYGLQTYVGVPMRTGGKIIGVLSVFGDVRHQLSVEELALLASIGDQVGGVIENARLRQRAEQAVVMEERARLARELHDSVTQSLYSITLLAGGGQRLARAGKLENVEQYLADMGEIGQQSLKEMRLLVHQLRPAVLEQEGLVGALQHRLDAVEGRSNVETRLLVEGSLTVPATTEEGLYRIAQEALNNALKHGGITSVVVRIGAEDNVVTLEVTDNGQGFDVSAASEHGGIGIISMQERAEKLNGSLTIDSAPGEGTTVKVKVKVL